MNSSPPVPPSEEEEIGSCDERELYYANSDFRAEGEGQLDVNEGDEVRVLEKVNSLWWWAELGLSTGYVPASHLISCDQSPNSPEDQWQDEEYFSSYQTLRLHLEMLHDKPRTLAYRNAIEGAKEYIRDRVVLDLGCGTGILSLFCAKLAGAAKVYAVDASKISSQAAKIIEHNGLSDRIEVIKCKGEALKLQEKVDLIISEWMGTLLMFELMLESVLVVRDNWLKEDGVMWPSHAELFLVPCSAAQAYQENVEFWKDVYGFDFSPLIPRAKSEIFGKPIYNHVIAEEDCLSSPAAIMKLKLKTAQVEDLEKNETNFSFEITQSGTLHGFGSWFKVVFGDIPGQSAPVVLSTSPFDELTHWKQDLFVIDKPLSVQSGDTVSGRIDISRNRHWRRHLRVKITYTHCFQGGREEEAKEYVKDFKLWK